MAGDWIKVELCTPDKPEVLRIARILGIDKDAVFGKLIRFWAWADKNSVDGVVDGVVDNDVDAICYQVGFGKALVSVGWLSIDESLEKIIVPKFDRHNGESAKKRALKTESQARWRQKVEQEQSTTISTTPSTEQSTTPSTREEKRRNKNKGELIIPDCISPESWSEWVEYRKERRLTCSEKTLAAQIEKLSGFYSQGYDANEIIKASISNGWQGLFEPKQKPILKPVPAGDPNEMITLPDGRKMTRQMRDFVLRMSA